MMEFRFNQKFLPDFTPPQKIIDEKFAQSVSNILFQQLNDGGEKIVSISRGLKEECGVAKYEGKIFVEDIVRCKDCTYSEGFPWSACPMLGKVILKDDDFCSQGERRIDELGITN